MSATYVVLATLPRSPFLRDLKVRLEADMGPEVELCLRVAVLAAADHPKSKIAQILCVSDNEVRNAMTRIRRVMKHG